MGKYVAPALDKGLDIIEYLSKMAIPQSQVEISQGIKKTPNEIYRMLVCLEERGYLNKDVVSGKFSLSLKLYHLSHRHTPVDTLIKASKPFMEALSNKTKQSCHLGILYHNQLMVVSQSRSPGPVSLSIEEGSLFPLTKTTSGRVLLASLAKPELDLALKNNTEFKHLSAVKKKAFLQQLAQINKQGHERMKSEITSGVTDMAVPIGKVGSGFFGSLAISSLTNISSTDNLYDVYVAEMKLTAEKINAAIGLGKGE